MAVARIAEQAGTMGKEGFQETSGQGLVVIQRLVKTRSRHKHHGCQVLRLIQYLHFLLSLPHQQQLQPSEVLVRQPPVSLTRLRPLVQDRFRSTIAPSLRRSIITITSSQ